MRSISVSQNTARVTLGHVGESGVLQVVFDISKWLENFGDGEVQLLNRRPGSTTSYYVEDIEIDDAKAIWTVNCTDTLSAGDGQCQLQYIADDGSIAKTRIWNTKILPSLGDVTDSCTAEVASDEDVEEVVEEVFADE